MVEEIRLPEHEVADRYRRGYDYVVRPAVEGGPGRVKIPPRAPGGHNFWVHKQTIPITEEEYVAMYRTQHVDYKSPDEVVVGMTITMPSGLIYIVSLPPRRVEEDPMFWLV